jgi:hypothetical protein
MTANAAERIWSLDREIVLTRVVDAPRELVFEAWTKPEHAMKWFGPKGFTCTLHEMDVRVGGRWRFDMFAPDGKLYPNRIDNQDRTERRLVLGKRRYRQRSTRFYDAPVRWRCFWTSS